MSVNPGAVGRPADPGSGAAGPPGPQALSQQAIATARARVLRNLPRSARRARRRFVGDHARRHVVAAHGGAGSGDRASPARQSPARRRHPRCGVRGRRSGGIRPRTADRHRLHPDGDGLGDGAAAPIRRFLHRDHEPGVPGAPRSGRGTARLAAARRCRCVSRGHRRVLDSRPARADSGQQGAHRGQAVAARRTVRRAPGGARFGCNGVDDARSGARSRHRPRGPLPRQGP